MGLFLVFGVAGAGPPQGALVATKESVRVPASGSAYAAAPDGRNLYGVGGTDSGSQVVVLRRNSSTGALTRLPRQTGCTSHCTYADALNNPTAAVVTPDGRDVIVSNRSGALLVYRRDGAGRLSRMVACVNRHVTGVACTSADLGHHHEMAVSPDGRNVYAVHSDSIRVITTLIRNAKTGRLVQPGGAAGCIVSAASTYSDCGHAAARDFAPDEVAVSPDGRNVYVGSTSSGSRGLYAYSRERTTGRLTALPDPSACFLSAPVDGCEFLANASGDDVVVSPDGRHVYAGNRVFAREQSTGSLTPLAVRGARVTAFSPDGRSAYATARGEDRFTRMYRRRDNGSLVPLPKPYDRTSETYGLAVTADGRHVYGSSLAKLTLYRVAK